MKDELECRCDFSIHRWGIHSIGCSWKAEQNIKRRQEKRYTQANFMKALREKYPASAVVQYNKNNPPDSNL